MGAITRAPRRRNKVRARSFANSSDGWRDLLDWLITQKIRGVHVHACMESTRRYSLGIACALYEAGRIVSIVNPAQIRDFARTLLAFAAGQHAVRCGHSMGFSAQRASTPILRAIRMGSGWYRKGYQSWDIGGPILDLYARRCHALRALLSHLGLALLLNSQKASSMISRAVAGAERSRRFRS